MALVDQVTPVKKEVPHEPGNWFRFRPLSGPEMDKADEVRTEKVFANVSPGLMAAGQEARAAAEKQGKPLPGADDSEKDPTSKYDLDSLMCGIVSWEGPHYKDQACVEGGWLMLDSQTRKWAADVIVELSEISTLEKANSGPGLGGKGSGDQAKALPAN